jgi:hypothetical protein
MRRTAARDALLRRAPDGPVELLPEPVLVRVRAVYGRAIAKTPTSVLHEWVRYGEYHVRWDEKWQVHPVDKDEWDGEPIG